MDVLLPRFYGMCFGVRDALEAANAHPAPHRVTLFGELVHNEQVNSRLAERGFRAQPEGERSLPTTPEVLITAHGVSDRERARLESAGLTIVDTTCPLVRSAHAAARKLDAEGRFVVVVGRADHVEVRGLVGDLSRFVVIAGAQEARRYEADAIGILSQTTTSPAEFEAAVASVRNHNPQASVSVIDTICKPTRDRQEGLAELLAAVEALVVVGGVHSRNTRELVRSAERAGVRALHVQSAAQLDPTWFVGVRRVGLTAGTSTLPETLDEVYQALVALDGIPSGV